MKDKCCGNCKHFVDKEVGGYGLCDDPNMIYGTHRSNKACSLFDAKPISGWTEITTDNVEELYNIPEELLIVAFKLGDTIYYQMAKNMSPTLNTLAKTGGYYYYVLPELKLEE